MMVGASVYAYIVGAICGILVENDRVSYEHMQLMTGLNLFMDRIHLSQEVRISMRR